MKFHIYRDKAGEWRWRLVARNGRIRADSGDGYTSKYACERSIWEAMYYLLQMFECDRLMPWIRFQTTIVYD